MSGRKSIPSQVRWSVLSRDRFTCRYCARSAPDVELRIDHVKAVSKGGTNDIENLVTACHDCNSGKSASDVDSVPLPSDGRRPIARHPLVGCGFLSFIDGRVCEQGLIVAAVPSDSRTVLQVQYFEWLMGEPTYQRLLNLDDLVFDGTSDERAGDTSRKTYRLFKDNEERNSYYNFKVEHGGPVKGPDAFGEGAR